MNNLFYSYPQAASIVWSVADIDAEIHLNAECLDRVLLSASARTHPPCRHPAFRFFCRSDQVIPYNFNVFRHCWFSSSSSSSSLVDNSNIIYNIQGEWNTLVLYYLLSNMNRQRCQEVCSIPQDKEVVVGQGNRRQPRLHRV
jgi:hypothetical protein